MDKLAKMKTNLDKKNAPPPPVPSATNPNSAATTASAKTVDTSAIAAVKISNKAQRKADKKADKKAYKKYTKDLQKAVIKRQLQPILNNIETIKAEHEKTRLSLIAVGLDKKTNANIAKTQEARDLLDSFDSIEHMLINYHDLIKQQLEGKK
jgi:hypothetical protein